jgi:hypothetical protein
VDRRRRGRNGPERPERAGNRRPSVPVNPGRRAVCSSSAMRCSRGRALQDHDGLRFSRLAVPDEQVLPRTLLRLNELVQSNGTVHQVGLRQAGPVLEALQVLGGLGNQGDSYTISSDRLQNGLPPSTARCLCSWSWSSSALIQDSPCPNPLVRAAANGVLHRYNSYTPETQ